MVLKVFEMTFLMRVYEHFKGTIVGGHRVNGCECFHKTAFAIKVCEKRRALSPMPTVLMPRKVHPIVGMLKVSWLMSWINSLDPSTSRAIAESVHCIQEFPKSVRLHQPTQL